MREIKFRAWDKDKEEMFSSDFITLAEFFEFYGKLELMQFTGLKDKNGKEIYEGDVVDVQNEEQFKIEWFEDTASWIGVGVQTGKGRWFENREMFEREFQISSIKSEVIGNIYENPELLH